jgi:hypothetical protein
MKSRHKYRYAVDCDHGAYASGRAYIYIPPQQDPPCGWVRIDVDRIGVNESKRLANKLCRQLNRGLITEDEARVAVCR